MNTPQDTVVGLYSFPKSGNTWLRSIIAAVTDMPMEPGVLQKYVTDTHYGRALANPWTFQDRNWYFYKSHHKVPLTKDGNRRLLTDKIIYIYRHPLDVFVSYLNFVSGNVSPKAGQALPFQFESVEALTPLQMERLFSIFLAFGTLFPQNKKFGGIFESIDSFAALKSQGQDVLILRYEDLQEDFETTVQSICSFLDVSDVDLSAVFETSEARTKKDGKFFWKKQVRNYENYLTDDQIARFTAVHGAAMTDLGYLTQPAA